MTRLLEGVDRSSPIGRRDYAVLLLSARYGLRPSDLRQLHLDAVDWREHVLSITQAKTGRVLTLPLLPDVADALIAYLRTARPATSSRYVFVRHKAPFEPFVAANNLATIMRQALQRVGSISGRDAAGSTCCVTRWRVGCSPAVRSSASEMYSAMRPPTPPWSTPRST